MTGVHDAMIVAGGAGTRLRPLTDTTPKPLLPFCGAPFLTGVIRRLAAVGVQRVHLVVGRDTSPFEVLRTDAAHHGVEVLMVPEPEPLDTAGGVRAAVDRIDGTFLVLNGDILAGVDLAAAVEAHRRADATATLVLTRVEDTSTFGVCVREGSRIVAFVEKPEPGTLPGQDTVNAGTYVLEPDALTRFPAGRLSFERQVFPGLVADGAPVEGFVDDGVWADLGTPERFRHGHRLALDGSVSWPTLADVPDVGAGVRVAPDAQVAAGAVLDGPVLVGPGVHVGDGARIGPYAVLGAGTRVGPSAQVQDSVVFDRAGIGEGARVEGALVGFDADIGVRAHLAGDTVLGDRECVAAGETLASGSRRPAAVTDRVRPT
jgi:mannose-1-phosphate guanylyltransferase